jgi:disulfide bond formation protein DsbB
MALLTLCCGVAAVHGPRRFGLSLYWGAALGLSLGGTTAAWRQVLLQSDPLVQMTRCAPDSEALFSNLPWLCATVRMLKGDGDCAEISWTLFDLSIPEWSLLFFVAMFILSVYQLLRLVWSALQRSPSGEASHRALVRD